MKTHFVYDGKQIRISSNLENMFLFLRDISNELTSLIDFEAKFNRMKQNYCDLLEYSSGLLQTIEANQLICKSEISAKHLEGGVKELQHFMYPIRSVCIALFSYLEVVHCIHTAYTYEKTDTTEIIKLAKKEKSVKKFLNGYLLTEQNCYYLKNKHIFSQISAIEIRNLRNLLVHFYSPTSKFVIIHKAFEKNGKILEQQIKENSDQNLTFLSPNMLHSLIDDAVKLILINWTKDCQEEHDIFNRKMLCVKKLVDDFGTIAQSDKIFGSISSNN